MYRGTYGGKEGEGDKAARQFFEKFDWRILPTHVRMYQLGLLSDGMFEGFCNHQTVAYLENMGARAVHSSG